MNEDLNTKFINNIRSIINYWAKVENQTVKQKCEGVAFSILNMIDGGTGTFPRIDLVVNDDIINKDKQLHELLLRK